MMEKISWTRRVRNEEELHRVEEDRYSKQKESQLVRSHDA